MATYPLPSLAPTIDLSGISAPAYSDIYQSLIASFQQIYGASIYVAPDSQDGQWLGVLAKAIHDSNQAAIACFQAFSPTYAQGTGLSSVVKLNGISRNVATHSTAVGNVIGVAGTIIVGGAVKDASGNLWNLPPVVTIPVGGLVSVTVTANIAGNITAPSGTINQIATPQLGWQTFTSTSNAAPGAAVETDDILRARQTVSTSLPALGIKEAIYAAVGNVTGVERFAIYENDTGTTDANGVPAHSFSVVVLGGDSQAIATAIAGRKPPGIQTYGTTTITVYDVYGFGIPVNYFTLTQVPVYFNITVKALPGYVATTGTQLIASLVEFVNALAIGEDVYLSQAQAAASLIGLGLGQTFYITTFNQGITASPSGTSNLAIAFNAAATCTSSNINLTVT